MLVDRGMSPLVPRVVSLCEGEPAFAGFDWNPAAYGGPTVWEFRWGAVPCSLACQSWLTLRVHDVDPAKGAAVVRELADELFARYVEPVPPPRTLTIYTAQKNHQGTYQWAAHGTRLQRSLSTVYIDEGVKDRLVRQHAKFFESSDKYDVCGITWKRNTLLYGEPGTGKTSTVLALASHFEKNVAKLTITPDMDGRQVENLFSQLPANTFLLVEDVDAVFVERAAVGALDFSSLLNCLDGITTSRGLVCFMTTNHLLKLDRVFLRPGRLDACVEFAVPGVKEKRAALATLAPQFAADHEEYLRLNPDVTIAELQKHAFDCDMEERTTLLPTHPTPESKSSS